MTFLMDHERHVLEARQGTIHVQQTRVPLGVMYSVCLYAVK